MRQRKTKHNGMRLQRVDHNDNFRMLPKRVIELIWHCCDRFLLSHWLHDPCAEITGAVYGRSAIVLDRLYLGWSRICTTYRRLMFDAQRLELLCQRVKPTSPR